MSDQTAKPSPYFQIDVATGDVIETLQSGVTKRIKRQPDGTFAEPVAVAGQVSTGGGSAVNFEDELYTVIKSWASLAVGSTVTYRKKTDQTSGASSAYWVNASDATIADPPSPIGDYVESALPSKETAVMAVIDAAGVLWRQYSNTATGGVTYYQMGAPIKGTPSGAVVPYGAQSRQTVYPFNFVAGTAVYTLPTAPTSASGAALRVTNIDFTANGVDWIISGTQLQILNAAVLASQAGTTMTFTYPS